MNFGNTSTPVVVIGMEHYGGLGIARSLGRLGVAVHGIDPNRRVPGFVSRYCREKRLWDIEGSTPGSTIAFLLSIGISIGRSSILIPTSDESALFVAEHAEALRKWFRFPNQPVELVRSLCSKKEMYFLSKKSGIPTAETLFPQSVEDVLRFLEQVRFPVMLKGIDGGRLEKRTGKKMVKIRTERELLEQYRSMEDPRQPNLMIQEYIPGGEDSVWMFNGYFDARSDCLLGFTGKKVRQNPVYTGMTSLGICLRNPIVEETTVRFMKTIGYRGVLDIGYRYDSREGLYKVLDVNPRIGATFRLFTGVRGMDVARALYLDLTGQPVHADVQRDGRKWIVEDKDIRSSIQYFRDGKLTLPQWIRSFRGIEEAGYFALDDLRPFIRLCGNHARRQLRQLFGLGPTDTRERPRRSRPVVSSHKRSQALPPRFSPLPWDSMDHEHV